MVSEPVLDNRGATRGRCNAGRGVAASGYLRLLSLGVLIPRVGEGLQLIRRNFKESRKHSQASHHGSQHNPRIQGEEGCDTRLY